MLDECCRGMHLSLVGRGVIKAEGPSRYEERAPSVAKVEILGLLNRKDGSTVSSER